MKVSFDYDGTLSNKTVQEYAKSITRHGIETWIVSSRVKESSLNPTWNNDLYATAKRIGIPKARIMLLNMKPKHEFFEHFPGFLWHLDDDWEECSMITSYTKTIGIPYSKHNEWKNDCQKFINKKT